MSRVLGCADSKMAGLCVALSLLFLCAAEEGWVGALSDQEEPSRMNIEHLFPQETNSERKGSRCPFAQIQRSPESLLEVISAVPGWTEGGVMQAYRSLKRNYPRLYLVLFYALAAAVVYRAAKGPGRPAAVYQEVRIAEDKSAKDYEVGVKAAVKRLIKGSERGREDQVANQMESLLQEHADFHREIIESHEMLHNFLSSVDISPAAV